MCLAVVAVAAMSVVRGGSATARVQEAATEVAEEADDGPGGWRLCSVFYCSAIFFSPSPLPSPKAEATLRSLAVRHIPGVPSSLLSLMLGFLIVAVIIAVSVAVLFPPPSPSPPP
jgi:hypothetical protein